MFMRSQRERGFTLIELLVVIAIIAILAAIIFPVFAKAQAKARQTTCLSNVRQLSTAMLMFAQDNRGTYPGAAWAGDIEEYVGNRKLFTCSADENGEGHVSYSYNSLMVLPDGTGVKQSALVNPAEVGCLIDGTSKMFPDCTIVGGGAGQIGDPVNRHSINFSFADGHAESMGSKASEVDLNDPDNMVNRAFYQAGGFGWVKNTAGGMTPPSGSEVDDSDNLLCGGSTTVMDLMKGCVDTWNAGNGSAENGNYHGSSAWSTGMTGSYANHDVLGASSKKTSSSGTETVVAKDAMVFIVAKNCKIPSSYFMAKGVINMAKAQAIFGTGASQTTTTDDGACWIDGTIHAYGRELVEPGSGGLAKSGTYEYVAQYVLAASPKDKNESMSSNIKRYVTNAQVVDAVAKDPYGIGYTGAGEADPNKVTILSWHDGSTEQTFSRKAVDATTVDAASYSFTGAGQVGDGKWQMTRPLYMWYSASNPAAVKFVAFVKSTKVQNAPIMKSLYFAWK